MTTLRAQYCLFIDFEVCDKMLAEL
jgi:hypothetical protein